MDSQTVILAIAILYLAVMFGVGWWANTKMKSAKEFLVAGQSLGFFVMAIASFSSIQSGWGMVGATGTMSTWGIGGLVATGLTTPLAFALAWFLLGGRLRRIAHKHEVYSIPDIVYIRYKSRLAHSSISVAMVIGAIGYMTAQVVAAGVIMALLLGIPLVTATWMGALIVAAYTLAGGMLAAVWTDLIQGLIMIVMSIVVFFLALSAGGGWSATMKTLSSGGDFLVIDSVQPMAWVLGSAVMIFMGLVAQPQLIHKFLMLKDTRELQWGATVAAIGYATTTLFSIGVGLAVRAAILDGGMNEPAIADDTANAFLTNFTHPIIAGLALTALLSAILSSASSFITIGAAALTRDIGKSLGREIKRDLLASRVGSLIIVAASLVVGLYLDQIIYLLGSIGYAAFGAAIFGPVVLGIYWRRGTGIAASISIMVGLILNIGFAVITKESTWIPPDYFFMGGFCIVVGIIVYVAVSVLTSSAEDRRRFDDLYPNDREDRLSDARMEPSIVGTEED